MKERDLLDTDDDHLIDNLYKLADQLRNGYVREPRELNHEIVFGDRDYVSESEIPEHGLLEITALRRKMENGTTSLTIMAVNKTVDRPRGINCIFQPELRIDSANNDFVFEKYAGAVNFDVLDEEEQSLELQYQNKLCMAPVSELPLIGILTQKGPVTYGMTFSRNAKYRPWTLLFRKTAE